jgi:hypothetical protein
MHRLIAALFLALVSASLHAQTMNMRATIPFAFRAGETVMPAGEYTIRDSSGTLILHNEGGPSVVLLTIAASRSKSPPDARLDFNRYRERNFLSSVWTSGSQDGREILKSRAEGTHQPGRTARVRRHRSTPQVG